MKYLSTRGEVSGLTFEEALFSGYASDGGLLLPEIIPELSKDTLQKWRQLSYKELVENIIRLFIDDEEINNEELKGTINLYDKID